MNLVAKTFLAACCLLSLSVSAELIHQDGGWRVKPGTSSGIIPDSRTDEILKTIDRAENLSIMREDRAALALWNKLVEKRSRHRRGSDCPPWPRAPLCPEWPIR
ncbi:hypothetical protein EMGBS8_17840 [Verrucomicrobiota bacterium]|nr:hypothetical protein EMGBS8_17840 [Verrucomicrobiota bacterium]